MAVAEVVKQGDKWAVKQIVDGAQKPSVVAAFETKKLADQYAALVNG